MANGTPKSIKHRCLEYHYTKVGTSIRYSTMHIYPWQIDLNPSQLSIEPLNTTPPNLADLADIVQCTYTVGRSTPSIEHRCLEYHCTKLGTSIRYSTMHIYPWQIDPNPSQLSIEPLNTTPPNLADLADIVQCTYTHGRSTPSIEHRCLEYYCTKLGTSIRYSTMHIYPWQIDPNPSQLSIDALNTTPPNLADLADIAQCTYTHGRSTPLNRA